eukprot:TRINITY_DN3728_c0_g1_i2.p1 TRINITY_DN3728_c0_g1~~TRINITY_DN3728_c0_g1_i2.p1  ORF type:complete len:194 (+),score=29.80 TRINITY_DN3728_c0_g1_i2:275-856(+)
MTAKNKPMIAYLNIRRCKMSTEAPQPPVQEQPQVPVEPVESQVVPFWAKLLGAAGLIPFVAGAVGPFVLPMEAAGQVVLMQMTYGATILAFLGAPHWGFAISEFKRADLPALTSSHQAFRYVYGVVPQLFAWFCLCSPPWHGALGLLVGLTGAFVADTYAARAGLVPTWYPKLRLPLTMGAVLSIGVTWMQLM